MKQTPMGWLEPADRNRIYVNTVFYHIIVSDIKLFISEVGPPVGMIVKAVTSNFQSVRAFSFDC
jgi:hypothetical protein